MVLEALPWPPPPPAGSNGWLIVHCNDREECGATTGARKDGYAELMARMFPPGDDNYWLQPWPPPCPGWGAVELEDYGYEDAAPYWDDKEDWDVGPYDPMQVDGQEAGDEVADEDGAMELEWLLRNVRVLRAESETALQRTRDKTRKTEKTLE